MINRLVTGAGLCLMCLFVLTPLAAAQQSRCADCHFANPDAPNRSHLSDWDHSAHARNNVGCEKCHGGDATTFESMIAHRDILHSGNPASPVNRRNLPATCGACHSGPFTEFQKSQHFALLQQGDTRTPVCTTCHGDAGFNRPSAKALATECARCHGPKGIAPRPERAEAARTLYEELHDSRDSLKAAKPMIGRVSDKARRARLEEAYLQAEIPLIQAVQAGHQFVYDTLKARLNDARKQLEALYAEIVNPTPQASVR